MEKELKIKLKWDWKIFWIIILILFWIFTSYAYVSLKQEYQDYQKAVENYAYEYELNLTRELSNFDCFDRGTVDCYEKGTVNCYGK